MAAAEARAAWQRMANRCFVQEDAKRAPKLACCPSPSSKLQPDSSSGTAANGADHPASSFVPFSWNLMDSNLPPETKWRLQLQPNFGYQNDIAYEELGASEELEFGKGESVNPTLSASGDPTPIAGAYVGTEKKSSPPEAPWMVSTNFVKHKTEARIGELKTVNDNYQHVNKPKADLGEPWYQNEYLMDWKAVDWSTLKKPEKASPRLESEKAEPWWRIADKDELASYVAQKSLENFENCDLPRPQRVHFCGDPLDSLEGFDDRRFFASSLDHRLHAGACYTSDFANSCSVSGNRDGGHQASGIRHSILTSAETCSGTRTFNSTGRPGKDPPEIKHLSECDSDKAELLEALHHSQKRAREAEMAAQQAYIEKEHFVKLFFKQASHLFAYKQWIRMLQLEKLFLQLKIEEHQITSLLPVLPWMTPTGGQFGSGEHMAKKRRGQKHEKCDACWYAIAFAVGLGLVSAGLLFGWTLGRLLPIF